MAKTNFTKVEEALNEGIRKIEVNRLLNVADETAAANASGADASTIEKKSVKPKVDAAHLQRLTTIHHELRVLEKFGEQPYIRLGIDKVEIKKFVKDPAALTADDWEKVKAIKELIAAYKKERKTPGTPGTDDELITQERKSQKTKRFNINNKWIPLR